MPGQLITLQCGHFANFVGAHFWNAQDTSHDDASEIDSTVLFREGITQSGEETYTPRLILFDLPGSLRTLKVQGEVYQYCNDNNNASTKRVWGGGIHSMQQEDSYKQTDYMTNLNEGTVPDFPADYGDTMDEQVFVWSDFLRYHLHPKTITLINQFEHGGGDSGNKYFGSYTDGWNAIANDRELRDDIEDRLHFFVEECDQLQGFQLFVDTSDGFGGFSVSLLEEFILDDYDKKAILSIDLSHTEDTTTRLRYDNARSTVTPLPEYVQRLRPLNRLLSFDALMQESSLVLPLRISNATSKFPWLKLKTHLPYHTSAVLASAIDMATLPFRLSASSLSPAAMSANIDMSGYLGALSSSKNRLAALSMALPLDVNLDESLDSVLSRGGPIDTTSLLHGITPGCDGPCGNVYSSATLIRGVDVFPSIQGVPLNTSEALRQLREWGGIGEHSDSATFAGAVRKSIPCGSPYPNFFSSRIAKNGVILPEDNGENIVGVTSVPSMCHLYSGEGLSNTVKYYKSETRLTEKSVYDYFRNAGICSDSFEEIGERILEMIEFYDTNSASPC